MKYMKELRQKAGLTQAELAERVGIGMNTIARYERGEMAPSIQIAHGIAEALGVSEATSRSQLQRARALLQSKIKEKY